MASPKRTVKTPTKEPAAPPQVIVAEDVRPDSYYWALFCGEPEVILTTSHGTHFYLHGDEYTRAVNNPLLIVRQFIGSRAEMIKRIKSREDRE